jgi:hypothetical protein
MDTVVLLLLGLLAGTLFLFLAGIFPYPFGVLVLLAFLVARILYKS